MNEAVKVVVQDGKQAVSAKELHAALEVGRDFSAWIKDRIEKYGFQQGDDYFPDPGARFDLPKKQDEEEKGGDQNDNLIGTKIGENQTRKPGRGGRRKGSGNPNFVPIDYILSVDMAKEIAVVENNEKGREVRRYLIKVDKAWNDPEAVFQRAAQTAGLVRTEAAEKALGEMEQLAVKTAGTPFIGSLGVGVPTYVERMGSTKGGRVYILGYRGERTLRVLVAYKPDGTFLAVGLDKQRKNGQLVGDVVGTWRKQYADIMGRIGGTERVYADDYVVWASSLIKQRIMQGAGAALPEPERPALPGNVLPFKKAEYIEDEYQVAVCFDGCPEKAELGVPAWHDA